MKKLLCLLLTLLLIHPALAEDALDAPDAASLLSCADGTVLAVSPDLRVLRRDSAGDWALVLSAEQISAACPPRFMPDAANALLLPGPPTRHTRASRWTAIPSISPMARRFTAPRRPMMLWNPSAICRRWTRVPVCPR